VIDLPEDVHQKVFNLFEEIIDESECNHAQGNDMLRVLILQLFITINRLNNVTINNGPASYNQTLLKNFQKLIGQHFAKLKLPRDYADLLYITPNHLNAICKDMVGMQAGEIIRNRILLEAKRLLTNPQLSITEISFMLNFNDNSYFTKFFRKAEGITPEEFRKNTINPSHHE
ncbi:MAG: AraC family transcriptional regulator, transcriptional activator of pobA, partial [Mucilaginibacter sp.]|nr:AraC family transcriptional regulator, transcriptional activator of pobA [Mucilaginibacter sp.]